MGIVPILPFLEKVNAAALGGGLCLKCGVAVFRNCREIITEERKPENPGLPNVPRYCDVMGFYIYKCSMPQIIEGIIQQCEYAYY